MVIHNAMKDIKKMNKEDYKTYLNNPRIKFLDFIKFYGPIKGSLQYIKFIIGVGSDRIYYLNYLHFQNKLKCSFDDVLEMHKRLNVEDRLGRKSLYWPSEPVKIDGIPIDEYMKKSKKQTLEETLLVDTYIDMTTNFCYEPEIAQKLLEKKSELDIDDFFDYVDKIHEEMLDEGKINKLQHEVLSYTNARQRAEAKGNSTDDPTVSLLGDLLKKDIERNKTENSKAI